MRILFVENHSRFAEIVRRQFLAEHEVTVVGTLAGARELLAYTRFDVVLLDYYLDDGKGDALLPELLALVPRPRIVSVSSHSFRNETLKRAGADAMCRKTEFAQIASVIDSTLPA